MATSERDVFTLSVIIPCYNGAATIAEQLDALAAQHWSEPWELIIADNGSTDGTREVINAYRSKLPHLRVVDALDRRGNAYARNVGIRFAAADRFAFCDVDDIVEPGWLAAMGDALAEHDFVASVVALDKLNEPHVRARWVDPPRERLPVCFDFLPAASGCGFGITRRLYVRVGGFDESLRRLVDIDYSWRAQLAGTEIHLAIDAVVQYRYRGTLKGLFLQAYGDGLGQVALYRKFSQTGMPRRTAKSILASCYGLMRSMPILRSQEGRGQWLLWAGETAGHLRAYASFIWPEL
jgi:glycosyltransferase involved in cell wall biosynthesis